MSPNTAKQLLSEYLSNVIMLLPYCVPGNFSDVETLANLAINSFSLKLQVVNLVLHCNTSTVCIGYKVTGCKNIAVITMEFQKITIKTCFSIVKISGKTISAIAIYIGYNDGITESNHTNHSKNGSGIVIQKKDDQR